MKRENDGKGASDENLKKSILLDYEMMFSRLPEEELLEVENWFFTRFAKGDSSEDTFSAFVDSWFSVRVLASFVLV